jgi:cyclic pyranopterin phosphate synthase
MTTATCHRPTPQEPTATGGRAIALPQLESAPPSLANPLAAITGPRTLAAVKMLRISVTDVCNLRCVYCMPEEGVEWLPKSHVLSFEEIVAIVRAAASAGITHYKLTGGEPTARRDLPVLAAMLKAIPGVEDLSLTTNGILLLPMLEKLKAAGVNRLTVSLDSLRPDRFGEITRGGDFARVWRAIERALELGFGRIKINVVVMKGLNEDEIANFAALTMRLPLTVRFIEFMPLGRSGLTDDPASAMVSEAQIRAQIEAAHGPLVPVRRESELGVGPAKVWQLAQAPATGGRLGFISAMSHPFCDTCNRLRLTPDGLLRSCLFDGGEVDLKPILRGTALAEGHHGGTEARREEGNLEGVESRLLAAFGACVTLKPETHSSHGNKAMNRIGG